LFIKNNFNITKLDSKEGNVSKFIFEKENDIVIESVLYKYPDYKTRTVLCISVQCGCPVGCSFCGTGKKFIRNLSIDEIVGQVEVVISHIDCDPKEIEKFQIMFMSMGEPFYNYINIKEAIIRLSGQYPNSELLVSTVAPKKIDEYFDDFIVLSKRNCNIGLQFSIHESSNKKRFKIIPNVCSLEEIKILGQNWAKMTGRKPFFNYFVNQNNSKDKNIKKLLGFFDPSIWEITLSVICSTWNDDQEEQNKQLPLVQNFAERMSQVGYSTRVFNPISEYGSGCGMLHHFQNWVKNI